MSYLLLWRTLTATVILAIIVGGAALADAVYTNYVDGQSAQVFLAAVSTLAAAGQRQSGGAVMVVTSGPDAWQAVIGTNDGANAVGSRALSVSGSGRLTAVDATAVSGDATLLAEPNGVVSVLVGGTTLASCASAQTISFTIAGRSETYEC